MSDRDRLATLERIVAVLGEEVARLNDENDALRAKLATVLVDIESLAKDHPLS